MARRVVLQLPAATGPLTNASGCVLFYAVRETSGAAAATVKLFDGSSAGGTLLLPVGLAAAGSANGGFVRCAVPFRQGLFYQLAAGAVEGAVAVLLDHDCEAVWAALARDLAQAGQSLTQPVGQAG